MDQNIFGCLRFEIFLKEKSKIFFGYKVDVHTAQLSFGNDSQCVNTGGG